MPKEKLLSPPQKKSKKDTKTNPPSHPKLVNLQTRIMDGTCFLDCPRPCDGEPFDHCTQRRLPPSGH
ncbi:hypothetical protein A2574_00755 [Candidatus Shapirobacteria bacterium RIFOXYD1_FULL_38_32]|uniref:Uncharacterized protein n=1 Tax=Candidatus Shapirobacteria bacterium GW2011_GWE1_38_92 TaxID=1618489 RepID=A0A0G0NVG6_9BACT|nr:MAG: hypothetical protein UT14_C0050G0010 [Candidatus Shapirobacteria bacterium GW2011_GWE1_38_92]OGL56373.1 MAG: hypothetical protein A2195_03235 [Candidatus Shapirobacteria bacterium RIFOXYA1_FULL_39_17]OGL56601.1 MAG: hypothetical protein A2410_01020 [Candidatus Shapirobacteria bacterium RIFOXYC1_FULL_38_24]OGL57991.1 MAG: hypothetical protein A2574_00755 [Candidatus Shapirobacteria bacterium RIFOXYD1_FULL_38_32]HAP37917.1 hypothetical protein [Candidatus Shapirobacteria bacterium]